MNARINKKELLKTSSEGIKKRIKKILTPSEFKQVIFTKSGSKNSWDAPEDIQKKILRDLK